MVLPDLVAKREAILELARKHGASEVRVIGSVARGEADERSDIDFLVRLESGRSLWDLGGLIADLEDLLGCKVDVVPEDWLRPQVRERALEDARPI